MFLCRTYGIIGDIFYSHKLGLGTFFVFLQLCAYMQPTSYQGSLLGALPLAGWKGPGEGWPRVSQSPGDNKILLSGVERGFNIFA